MANIKLGLGIKENEGGMIVIQRREGMNLCVVLFGMEEK